jgi:hypothetical protein
MQTQEESEKISY